MKGFDSIALEWDGVEYAVPADRQLELVMRVEDGLIDGKDRQAFEVLIRRSGVPINLLGKVYAEALNYVGANVTPIEVVRGVNAKVAEGDGAAFQEIVNKLSEILGLLAAPVSDDDAVKPRGKAGKKTRTKAG